MTASPAEGLHLPTEICCYVYTPHLFNSIHKILWLSLQVSLESENDRYHDLLQGSFKDTYRNLTYKHITVLKWVLYYCPGVRYVLKSDDDVFVNTPMLMRTLVQVEHYSTVGLWHFKTRNQGACLLPNPHANKLHSACSRWHLYIPIWLCT